MIELPIVPAASITIASNRQRQSKPESYIKDLAQSIKENGLIHAPTVTDSLELTAGECRITAILMLNEEYEYGGTKIPAGFVPIVIKTGKSELELFRIELEENLRRKNLTPVEESKAMAKLHRMLTDQAGERGWTKAETAEVVAEIRGEGEVKSVANEVAENLLIESFADDPDIQKAKTRSEATKLAKKKLEQMFTQSLGASMQALQSDDFKLIEGDCHEILPTLPAETFAGIIADPPYGVDADQFGEQAFHAGHEYSDSVEVALAVADRILAEGFRICKPDAHLYMFCDIRLWPTLAALAKGKGWQVYATPLIWYKPNAGHAPQPGYFTRRYETILFARKGGRKLVSSAPDVLPFPSVKFKEHAAQKPQELYEHLMKLSFFPGEQVLDPTCGSGTIFRAAKAAGMRAVGIEKIPEAINISKKTLGEL